MTARKKLTPEEIEHQLLHDANNPDAWEPLATVGASPSPRPAWYRTKKNTPRTTVTEEPAATKK